MTIAPTDLKDTCHSWGADPLIHRMRREWHRDPTAAGGHLMVSKNHPYYGTHAEQMQRETWVPKAIIELLALSILPLGFLK